MKIKEISDTLYEMGLTEPEVKYFFDNNPKNQYVRALGKEELKQATGHLVAGLAGAGLTTSFILKTGCDLNNVDAAEVAQAGLITTTGAVSASLLVGSYKQAKSGLEKLFTYKSYH